MRIRIPSLIAQLKSSRWVIGVPYAWMITFFLIPFFIILKISLAAFQISIPPYGDMFRWIAEGTLQIELNFTNYAFILSDSLYLHAYLQSIAIAVITTLGCLIVGYPIAYGIAKSSRPLHTIFLMMIILPFWTSFLLRVYAWMDILSPNGIIDTALMYLGLADTPLQIINTPGAAITGLIYMYLPFMIFPLYTALEKIDHSIVEASYDLGARPRHTFFRIILPLSKRGIATGSILVMIPVMGEFIVPELLGGTDTLMIGKVLWMEFFNNRDWPVASALAVITLLIMSIPLLVLQRLDQGGDDEN